MKIQRSITAQENGPLTLGLLRTLLADQAIAGLPDEWRVELDLPSWSSAPVILRLSEPEDSPAVPAVPITSLSSIDDLDLSTRTYNILQREGITTVGKLLDATDETLLGLRNFRQPSLIEIDSKLELYDLHRRRQ